MRNKERVEIRNKSKVNKLPSTDQLFLPISIKPTIRDYPELAAALKQS